MRDLPITCCNLSRFIVRVRHVQCQWTIKVTYRDTYLLQLVILPQFRNAQLIKSTVNICMTTLQ